MLPDAGHTPQNAKPNPLGTTRRESDEEIREALQSLGGPVLSVPPVRPRLPSAPTAPVAAVEKEPPLMRPRLRPPVGLLCVFDDGELDGEWVRLRNDVTVLGRSEGDVLIPHDGLISGKHAQLVREALPDGGSSWSLVDLNSTNGTFLRVSSTALRHEMEFLIGDGRYRFEAPNPNGPESGPRVTRAWSESAIQALAPALVELLRTGPGQRWPLVQQEYWIGRDPRTCAISQPNDVLLNARHARLFRGEGGHWHLKNNKSRNGIWLRITEPVPLKADCQFRLGEQRFLFRVKP